MKIIGIGVLLQTADGTYLFQERDHNTDKSPGQIAPFGGGLEDGEDVLACAQRELQEELVLSLATTDLKTIGTFESHNQQGSHIQMFITKGVDKTSLELKEGKSIVELLLEDALNHPMVTTFTKEVLRAL